MRVGAGASRLDERLPQEMLMSTDNLSAPMTDRQGQAVGYAGMIGASAAMQHLFEQIALVAEDGESVVQRAGGAAGGGRRGSGPGPGPAPGRSPPRCGGRPPPGRPCR